MDTYRYRKIVKLNSIYLNYVVRRVVVTSAVEQYFEQLTTCFGNNLSNKIQHIFSVAFVFVLFPQ